MSSSSTTSPQARKAARWIGDGCGAWRACVAGGIGSVADAEEVLNAGAEKVSVNSPALQNPALIGDLSRRFGSQCVVVGIDSLRTTAGDRTWLFSGDPRRARDAGRAVPDWVREVQARGAGEIVLNCMGVDGARGGFDVPQLKAMRAICQVPLVASGGAGTVAHFSEVFTQAGVDAALAASVFHCNSISIPDLKAPRACLRRAGGIPMGADRPLDAAAGERVLQLADLDGLDFGNDAGLMPAIVQHAGSGAVLMLGYMNREALRASLTRQRVVFFSRSRQRLWEKGETSGHVLQLAQIRADCDRDALLVSAWPHGPVCHLGTASCFGDAARTPAEQLAFLDTLDEVIGERMAARPEGSYTARLVARGARRVAQKVGEEGLEVALAGAGGSDAELVAEAADLLYHVLVLLRVRGLALERVIDELRARHAAKP